MALLKYFKTTLSTAKEKGIGAKATKEANAAVSQSTSPQRENRKRKAYTFLIPYLKIGNFQYYYENLSNRIIKKRSNFKKCQNCII